MRLKKECKVRDVAGEKIVVMQGREGMDLTKVIMLNDTAEFLWNKLAGVDFTNDDVAKLIADNSHLALDIAQQDACAWTLSLERAGLLEK